MGAEVCEEETEELSEEFYDSTPFEPASDGSVILDVTGQDLSMLTLAVYDYAYNCIEVNVAQLLAPEETTESTDDPTTDSPQTTTVAQPTTTKPQTTTAVQSTTTMPQTTTETQPTTTKSQATVAKKPARAKIKWAKNIKKKSITIKLIKIKNAK